MAGGSTWSRLRSPPTLLRKFSVYLLGWATWIPVLITINSNVAQLTFVNGASMYPTLNPEYQQTLRRDLCLDYRLRAQEGLCRGMIVTFKSPYHPDTISVKRITGVEGDIVHTRPPYPFRTIKVPPGHLWVEGDGGEGRSLDSNTYGPISVRLVTGRITHVLWPWHRAGRVRWWEFETPRRPHVEVVDGRL